MRVFLCDIILLHLLVQFNTYDTVQITSTIHEKNISLRGFLISYLPSFVSPNPNCFDGVCILIRVDKFIIPIKIDYACEILTCKIVLFEKVIVNKKAIEKLEEICKTRRTMMYIRRLEKLYQE